MSTLLCRFQWLIILVAIWVSHTSTKEVRIVCYYTNWSVYRPGSAKFNPQNINPYLCTHLVYAFGGFTKENTLKPFDKYQDIEKGGYAKFVGLKTYNKNLKTLLAIGGWNEGSTRFSSMVANADRRKELIKNAIKFLRQNHFDGLDLDWEYPSFRDGGKPRDKDNYAQLVQELREEFERESEKTGRPRLLLTMAVPAGIEYINKGYDVPKLTKHLDWMNILSYDYHSAYEPSVNHHSPLYPLEEESEYNYDIDLNVDYTIKHYLKAGADKSKLVLGIPTYGRSYTLYNPDANEVGAPADGPGEMGEATRENGYLAYYEICESIKSGEWIVETPYPDAMGPYAYKDDQWVGYDDATIASKKAEYVAENGLGGIMFWSIDNDDFRGSCGNKPYPIIEAAKEALLRAYGLTDASLLVTKKPIKSRTKTRTRGTTTGTTTEVSPTKSQTNGGRQSGRRKINRPNGQDQDNKISQRRRRPTSKANKRKIVARTESTESSLVITPSYTTPAPPSTPDTGGEFKCEDEGFFPHPRDCKKYFWCLSGTADQIVAHQFTCPAGLYFNKAAASCDYSQNVLCNKKISKTTTTTAEPSLSTTSGTTTTTGSLSTRRPLPRITAATSRTTLITSSAAPEYEDEYEEYEDEDEVQDSEEDPRVIKELLELIKKAGGIEELEKQLKIQDDGTATVVNSGSTTPSTISKTLYQRVLGRATAAISKDNKFSAKGRNTLKYSSLNRNSRGPQNEGLEQTNEEPANAKRARPQYSSIQRQRPSTEATSGGKGENEEPQKEDDHDFEEPTQPENKRRTPFKNSQPEYVTIRRQRISTTTAESSPEDERTRLQLKRLGEEGEDDDDDEQNEYVRSNLRTSSTPSPYVTIKRTRPTTTSSQNDENDVAKRRPGADSSNESEGSTAPPEHVGVKPKAPFETTTSKYVEIRSKPTSTSPLDSISTGLSPTVTEVTKENASTTDVQNQNTSTVTPINSNNYNTSQSPEENTVGTSDLSAVTEKEQVKNDSLSAVVDSEVKENAKLANTALSSDKKRPQLYEPRPFSFSVRTRPTTTTTTKTTTELPASQQKVSATSSPRNALKNKLLEAADSVITAKKYNQANAIFKDGESPDATSKDDEVEGENKGRLRGRGASRFRLENTATTARTRQRIRIQTEEADADYETTEYVRKFRPDISSEIADLSSLTAVDLKDFSGNRRRKVGSRRQRPVAPSTEIASTSTTTEKPEESLKTSARTLPLARKFLSSASFGKSRRVTRPKSEANAATVDQENAFNFSKNSDRTEKTRPKLRRPVTDRSKKVADSNSEASTNSNNAITENDVKLTRFRKSGDGGGEDGVNVTSTGRPIRRVVRRFRTTSTTTTTTQPPITLDEGSNSASHSIRPNTAEENFSINVISKSDASDDDDNLTTEAFAFAGSNESAGLDGKKAVSEKNLTEVLVPSSSENRGGLIDADEDDADFKSSEEEEEGENIKLSESNIRENSQISGFPNGNIIQEIKPGRKLLRPFRPAYEGPLSKNDEAGRPNLRRPVTEPNIIVRTRKIVRKLKPTPGPDVARTRSNEPTTLAEEVSPPSFRKTFQGRRRYGYTRQTSSTTEKLGEAEGPRNEDESNKPTFGKRRFGVNEVRNGVEKTQGTNQLALNKSIYSRRKFFSTTTTTTTEETVVSEGTDANEATEVSTVENGGTEIAKGDTTTPGNETAEGFGATEKEFKEFVYGGTRYGASERRLAPQKLTTNVNNLSYHQGRYGLVNNTQGKVSSVDEEEELKLLANTESEGIKPSDEDDGIKPSDENEEPKVLATTETEGVKLNDEEEETKVSATTETEGVDINDDVDDKPGNMQIPPLDEKKPGNESGVTIDESNAKLGGNATLIDEEGVDQKENNRGRGSETGGDDSGDNRKQAVTTESALSKLYKRRKLALLGKNKTESGTSDSSRIRGFYGRTTTNGNYYTEEEGGKNSTTPKDVTDNIIGIAVENETSTVDSSTSLDDQYFTITTTEEWGNTSDARTDAQVTEILSENNTIFATPSVVDVMATSDYSTSVTTENDDDDALTTLPTTEELVTQTFTRGEGDLVVSPITDFTIDKETSTLDTTSTSRSGEEGQAINEESTTGTTSNRIETTTARKQNRIFRPIASRPKFTIRHRTTQNTSPNPLLTASVSQPRGFKSTRRYNQFRNQGANRFALTSTTERFEENEELGYGPVKAFKPILRVTTESGNDYEEEEEAYDGIDDKDALESDEVGYGDLEEDEGETEESSRNKPQQSGRGYFRQGFKPKTLIKQNNDAQDDNAETEDDQEERRVEPEVEEEEESDNKKRGKFYKYNQINSPVGRSFGGSSPKPSTRAYGKFTSTTPAQPSQNLTDIDVEALSLRNKNLFNRTRKMNTPFAGVAHTTELNAAGNFYTSSEATTSTTQFTSYDNEIDLTEQAKTTEATDKPTTLLHVFAETISPVQDSTASYNETDDSEPANKKLEKVIEVNRLIKISAKEDKVKDGSGVVESKTTLESMSKLDRIGAINRLTEIHVVDGVNASEKLPAKISIDGASVLAEVNKDLATSSRSDRKYEAYGDIKASLDVLTPKNGQVNQIHIDSKSVVSKITPKPFYKIDSSTIPLEGLFQTDSPLKYHNSFRTDSLNELLEGENSNYVNVRILEQDGSRPNRIRLDGDAKFVPIKILRDEGYVTMKADVVEVTPINSRETIKIAPISVSFQKKIA